MSESTFEVSVSPIPLSCLTLFPATKAQVIESRKRSFASWGRGATLEQYLARDARSDNHEVSKDGRLVTWVLARRDNAKGLNFLCSCETFKRDGLAVIPTSSTHAKLVTGYGIASVFTPPQIRKKGYAAHMMRLLHWVLAPRSTLPERFPEQLWGEMPSRALWEKADAEQVPQGHGDNAVFSVLYSDIGGKFYANCSPTPSEVGLDKQGWVAREPISTEWAVDGLVALLNSREVGVDSTASWEWLDEKSAYEIWKVDAEKMKDEMEGFARSTRNSDQALFTFLPDKGVAEFQVDRLRHFWGKVEPLPIYWGVYRRDGEAVGLDPSTFATWTLDVRPGQANDLIITRVRARPGKFEALMKEVVGFAKRHGVEKIEVWGLGEELRNIIGGRTWNRDEHLSSFKWYGKEKDVNWCFNEKFCWC
ncbi:hypothetical protein CPB84DRAFT_1780294 [Gymnopilus junonius]|uniref:LYC1 C-terminal domain-containing protein n=1 Tax=Gymnopilus junonius TaxID=109634 RepID=A0A9P5TNC9_GYMJU|nr:hypothetical protein CPB84DRAFT_1780294 [Gymnopilus junonius]